MKKRIFSLFTSLIMVISLLCVMPVMTVGAYKYENVSAYPDFDMDTYVAGLMTDSNCPIYKSIAFRLNDIDFPATIMKNTMEDNKSFMLAINAWEVMTFKPGDIAKDSVNQIGYYESIILSVLKVSVETDYVKKTLDNRFIKNSKNLYSAYTDTLKGVYGIADITGKSFKDISKNAAKGAFSKAFKETFPKISNTTKFIDVFNTFVDSGKAIEESINNLCSYLSCYQLSDYIKKVVSDLYNNCNGATDPYMKQALNMIKQATESEILAYNAATFDLASKGFAIVFEKAVNDMFDAIIAADPMGQALLIGQGIGKSISNVLFNTDATCEHYYKICTMTDFEILLKNTIRNEMSAFKNQKTNYNANVLFSSVDALYALYDLSCDYANKYADIIYSESLVGPFLNDQYHYSEYVESVEDLRALNNTWYSYTIKKAYLDYLSSDYPEIYEALMNEIEDGKSVPYTKTLRYEAEDFVDFISEGYIVANGKNRQDVTGKLSNHDYFGIAFDDCFIDYDGIKHKNDLYGNGGGVHTPHAYDLPKVVIDGQTNQDKIFTDLNGNTTAIVGVQQNWDNTQYTDHNIVASGYSGAKNGVPGKAVALTGPTSGVAIPITITQTLNKPFEFAIGYNYGDLPTHFYNYNDWQFQQGWVKDSLYVNIYTTTNLTESQVLSLEEDGWCLSEYANPDFASPKLLAEAKLSGKLQTAFYKQLPVEAAEWGGRQVTNNPGGARANVQEVTISIPAGMPTGQYYISVATDHNNIERDCAKLRLKEKDALNYYYNNDDSYWYELGDNSPGNESNYAEGNCTENVGTAYYDYIEFHTVNNYSSSENKPVEIHSHTSQITVAPTCTTDGIKTFKCSCGDSYTEVIPKLGHSYTTQVISPTCLEIGCTSHICSRCGDVYVDTFTSATGHNFSSWTTIKTATCTVEGSKTRKCTVCSITQTQTVPKTGHIYTTTIAKPTCLVKGYSLHKCSVCGDSYKDTYTEAKGHTYSSWSTTKNATCITNGLKIRKCSECSAYESQTITATGHSYVSTVVEPTTTEKGYTLHTCTGCGDEYKDTYTNMKAEVKYQLRTNDDGTTDLRFILVVNEDEIANIDSVIMNVSVVGYDNTVSVPITKAYRSILAGSEKVSAGDGKVFLIGSSISATDDMLNEISAQFVVGDKTYEKKMG